MSEKKWGSPGNIQLDGPYETSEISVVEAKPSRAPVQPSTRRPVPLLCQLANLSALDALSVPLGRLSVEILAEPALKQRRYNARPLAPVRWLAVEEQGKSSDVAPRETGMQG